MPAPGPGADRRQVVTGMVLVTLLALVLRSLGANNGLWIDEIFSLVDSFRLPFVTIATSYPGDTHHPLYSLLAHLSLILFGEAPWSIRLPSILVGAASVPLLYLLGREVGSRREALFAAAFLAVSYHHVWFSQNARGYVILAACAMAGTWFLLRLLTTGEARFAAGHAVATALGAYTHLTMVFIAVGQALAVGLYLLADRGPGDRRRLGGLGAGAFGAAAIGTVLLYLPALPKVLDHFLHRPSQLVGVSTTGWALAETARVLAAGFGAGNPYLGVVVLVGGMVVGLTGVVSLWRNNRAATALFLLPFGAILAGAMLARGTMYPRFFFALAGFAILIGVRGIVAAAEWVGARLGASPESPLRTGAALMLLLGLVSVWSLRPNYRYPKQDFAGALAQIDASMAPGDTVAVTGVTDFAFHRYLGRDAAVVTTASDLAELRQTHTVWIAWAFPRYLAAAAPGFLETLDRDCTRAAVFRGTIGGGDVHVCRLELTP